MGVTGSTPEAREGEEKCVCVWGGAGIAEKGKQMRNSGQIKKYH